VQAQGENRLRTLPALDSLSAFLPLSIAAGCSEWMQGRYFSAPQITLRTRQDTSA